MHLPTAEYVFVRLDGLRLSLTPLYDGTHRVARHSYTFFLLTISDREDFVSVSLLKPLLASGPVEPALPRSSGRPP